jgi:sugar transferase EpsL
VTVKRAIDLTIAGLLLLTAALPLAFLMLLVRVVLGSPALFRQVRIGLHEKPFEILKIRTMTNELDSNGDLKPAVHRQTPLGRLLRKSSLDELPQLWNVLRGEMSIVGPRPLHPYYLAYYTARERRRHDVRPGITGLAQVNGRKLLDWDSRLERDVQYVEQTSLALDARIIIATITALFRFGGQGADPDVNLPTLAEYRRGRSGKTASQSVQTSRR